MGIEQEILKHFDLCAVLMSDPKILREHPGLVADQLQATRVSIEALGGLLRPKQVDPCGCHTRGWMDVSIIKDGIGHMVSKLLQTHLGVIRLEKFPCIVQVELNSKIVDEPDNYTEREIKESSCMGAIVLLYYYLYWYLFLIRMNQRIDPVYCSKNQLDIDVLITKLPRSNAYLEFRHLGEGFRRRGGEDDNAIDAKVAALLLTQATYPYMFSENSPGNARSEQQRKTMLVAAYRRALDTNLGDVHILDTGREFPANLKTEPSFAIFNTITADAILVGTALMGGMASVLERANPMQKWKEMHQVIPVYGPKTGSKTAKYNGKMATILAATPYSNDEVEFKYVATKACVYDHCSAALMMDVCRSFQKLAELVKALSMTQQLEFEPFLILFLKDLAGKHAEADALTTHFKKRIRPDLKKLDEADRLFTSKDDGALMMHEATTHFQKDTSDTQLSIWLDEFKNHHPTRTPALAEDINRASFLFDYSLEKQRECMAVEWLSVVQSEMIEFACNGNQTPFCTAYAVVILASFMRNTWMVKHAAHSTKAVIEKLTFTPGLRNAAMLPENAASEYNTKCSGMDALSSLHNISLTGYMDVMPFVVANIGKQSFKVKISLPAADITALATICADYVKDTAVSLTDITEHAARQTRTLTALMAVAKDFYRYPALAWPVLRKGGDDNIGSFELVHERHRHGNQSGDDVVNQIAELVRRAEMAETNTLRNRTDVAVMYQLAVELVKAKSAAEGGVPE